MSLQNLTKPNNYELYINAENIKTNEIIANEVITTSLKTDNLSSNVEDDITLSSDILPFEDGIYSIGTQANALKGIFVYNISGNGGVFPFNAVAGISGATDGSGDNYSLYLPKGLSFSADNVVPGTANSLNHYQEYVGVMNVEPMTTTTTTQFSAVRVGNILNVSIEVFTATLAVGSNVPITLSPVSPNIIPVPTHNQIVYVTTNVNGVYTEGSIVFRSNGEIFIYSNNIQTGNFTNNTPSGIAGIAGDYVSFSILLN